MVVERIDVRDTLVDVALRAAITADDNHIAGDRIEDLGRAKLVGRNCVCRGEVHPGLGIPDVVDLVERPARRFRPCQTSRRGRPATTPHGAR